jgi:hypothetical protein
MIIPVSSQPTLARTERSIGPSEYCPIVFMLITVALVAAFGVPVVHWKLLIPSSFKLDAISAAVSASSSPKTR